MSQSYNAAVRDRIIEVREIRLGDVLPHDDNPKVHPDKQRKALRAEVRNLGWAGIPLAYHSERKGGALTWCDGHMRASEFPDLVARVAITDYNDSEVDQLLPLYDFIGTMSKTIKESAEALINRQPIKVNDLATVQAAFVEKANLGMSTLSAVHEAAGQAPDRSESPIGRTIAWPRWNKKHGAFYLSLRSWRRSTQRIDLETFKQVKIACPRDVIEEIAGEIAGRLQGTFRNMAAAGAWFTAPPRGHTKSELHFASEIAKATAGIFGLPYYKAFQDRDFNGKSASPATFRQRLTVELDPAVELPAGGLAVVIDDIATTGTTLEACQNTLAAAGYATLPVAWLTEITEAK